MVRICNDPYPSNSKYENYFELFSYPLSDFQKYAIEAIVEGHHVLVTAHTGSGKTLPAEFAIQHFVSQGKKVIYTSPIKALSNQKYYEFTQKYPHISFGLMTGDIKTNPNAQVLIMTTEILMNSLFVSSVSAAGANRITVGSGGERPNSGTLVKEFDLKSSKSQSSSSLQFQIDINKDLACVVFDEVHYINDKERGQTWEKTILMLPAQIQMVMLSATIDAPERFAKWCERGLVGEGAKEVYLASTYKRVVPLTHYGYMTTVEGIYKGMKDKILEKEIRSSTNELIMIQNAKGDFQDDGFRKLTKLTKVFDEKQIHMKRKQVLNSLSLFLRDRDMLPAIAFVFSRKQVEMCASEITVPLLEDDSKISYIVKHECDQIVRKLPNYKEYLELPEYVSLVALLEKGIGIHHSGMIPILREIVELMISKKYIKLLFATESFAIGLDCPIKTTVFTGITKFDGNDNRILMSHEYTQMAGRAGRRGIDTIGYVVHCNNLFNLPVLTEYKGMLCGKPQELVSKFRISYSLILNLIKNGKSTDFDAFVNKSMIYNELYKSIKVQRETLSEIDEKREKKIHGLELLHTPVEICRRYIKIEQDVKQSVNKKRKELEREMSQMTTDHYFCAKDVIFVKEYDQICKDYINEQDTLEYMESYIPNQIGLVCNILEKRGFIEFENADFLLEESYQFPIVKEPSYRMTMLGKMASSIAEIHPLIITQLIQHWNYFDGFTVVQIIGLLACFTDVKVPDDAKISKPATHDLYLNHCILELQTVYTEFETLESENDMRTGINYYDALQFDMTDFAMDWCKCTDEFECKDFIQNRIAEKSISIGDFTKAMMKISTIAKEWSGLAEEMGNMEWLYKLSQIDGLILKYVMTSQSLYV